MEECEYPLTIKDVLLGIGAFILTLVFMAIAAIILIASPTYILPLLLIPVSIVLWLLFQITPKWTGWRQGIVGKVLFIGKGILATTLSFLILYLIIAILGSWIEN